jgi:ribosome-associated protein
MSIDLVGKTSIADRMIIASGTSARMVSAMADHLLTKLKADGIKAQSEGQKFGDWVVIDAGDVIVHLFRPEVRTFYAIERIWATPVGEAGPKPKAKTAKKAPAKKAAPKARAKSAPRKSARRA